LQRATSDVAETARSLFTWTGIAQQLVSATERRVSERGAALFAGDGVAADTRPENQGPDTRWAETIESTS
jgi:hypothetical protein